MTDPLSLADDVISRALKAGADAADVVLINSADLSVARRLDQLERLERSESRDLGLRVLIGRNQAIVSTTDHKSDTIADMIERAVAMARAVPEDEFCGLADPDQLFTGDMPELDLYDAYEPTPEALIEATAAAEATAMAVPGVTNSGGAEAGWGTAQITLAASNGFSGHYRTSQHSLSVSVLAGEGTAMQRDYDFTSAIHHSDLKAPETIGKTAGEKAVRRLNPLKGKTGRLPVVLDPRVSAGMVRSLASAINGAAIARGTSFLKDRMNEQIFSDGVTIVDDPFIRRGQRSRPFDGEGLAPSRRALVDQGRLTGWLLDLRSARKLGLSPTGNAGRGTSGPPSPSMANMWMEPGPLSPEELIAETGTGIYVSEMMGMGVNMVTGDYSRGAAGFMIENGEIAGPVSEITIAGNLKSMFMEITPASDLERKYGIDAPTLRIAGMTIAGE